MTSAYCTVLSKGRLYQAIALFGSLKAVQADAPIFTLCMDQDTYDVLQAMRPDNVTLIQVSALENQFKELLIFQCGHLNQGDIIRPHCLKHVIGVLIHTQSKNGGVRLNRLHSFIKRKAVSGHRFVRLIESGSGGRPHFYFVYGSRHL